MRPSGPLLEIALSAALLAVASAQTPPREVQWTHLSSKSGDLPVPPGSDQQTFCLTLDVNRDRRTDFVIGCRGKAPALVWYRRQPRGWSVLPIDTEATPIEAGGAAVDVDGDRDLDLIAGNDYQGSRVYWYENPYPRYEAGTPWKRHAIKTEGARQHHDQLAGDVDGDRKPEVVFWNQGARELYLARIPRDPSVEPWPYEAIYSGGGEGLAMADIDGDGQPDLLAAGRWLKRERDGGFAPHVIDAAQESSRIAVGNLKGDRRPEVVMVPGDGVGRLKWYECEGDPKDPKAWVGHDLLGADVVHGHSLAVADINGDRHPDIFCAEMAKWTESAPTPNNPKARMWIFYGDGEGGFTRTEVATGFGAHEARVADLDGDGDLDILSKPYNWDTPRLDVWLNGGTR